MHLVERRVEWQLSVDDLLELRIVVGVVVAAVAVAAAGSSADATLRSLSLETFVKFL